VENGAKKPCGRPGPFTRRPGHLSETETNVSTQILPDFCGLKREMFQNKMVLLMKHF